MHVAQLGEMGFGRRRATMALELTGGNMQRATALLLSGELDAIAPGLEDDDGLSSSGSSLAGSEDGDDGSPRAAPPADHAAAARGFVFGEGGQEARPRLVATQRTRQGPSAGFGEGRRPRSPPRAPRAPVAAGLRRAESPPRARRAPVTDEAVTQIVRSRTIVLRHSGCSSKVCGVRRLSWGSRARRRRRRWRRPKGTSLWPSSC